MTETKANTPMESSNELVRWLQLLVLPLWARVGLVMVMLAIVSGSLALLAAGLMRQDKDSIAAAMTLLTVALPVMLVVVALVFSQSGEKRLKLNTAALLSKELPAIFNENLAGKGQSVVLATEFRGCRADYKCTLQAVDDNQKATLDFSVEVNVRKVNFSVRLMRGDSPETTASKIDAHIEYTHVISGAQSEGYRMNDTLDFNQNGQVGIVFFRELEADFLLRPAARLYFCQDLCMFVRGLLNAQLKVEAQKTIIKPVGDQS